MPPSEAELLTAAREIEDLHFEIFESGGLDVERLRTLLIAYTDARRRLRLLIGDTPVITLPVEEHAREREVLQRALLNNLPFDRFLQEKELWMRQSYDNDELESVARNYLAWFSHYDYAEARLEGAVLVLRAGKLPDDLLHFVSELEECFAFQCCTAVISLCRTTLEVGLLPIYRANRLDHPDSENSAYVRQKINRTRAEDWRKKHLTEDRHLYSHLTLDDFSPSLDQMITRLCWLPPYSAAEVDGRPLRMVMHELRDDANSLIHGNSTGSRAQARTLMFCLFQSLHTLYEIDPLTSLR